MAEIRVHSAAWPSGEEWKRREAKNEADRKIDKVELKRHTLPRREERARKIEKLL